MRKKLFLYVIVVLQQTSHQIVQLNETKNAKAMADCISRITNMLGKLKLAMWYSLEEKKLALNILEKAETPAVVNTVEHSKKIGMETRVPSEVVVVLSKLSVERVLKETLWNKETRFFLIGREVEDFVDIFENFWKFKIVNVFLTFEQEEDVVIYSFIPYGKENCGVGKPLIVDKYISKRGNFINNGEAFLDPVRIKSMNGCRVNITVVDVKPNVMFEDECGCNATTHGRGIEANIMNEVARKFNFNASFLIALDGIGWGWIRPSPHGAVGEVFTGRSDFAIGLLAPTIERYESLDLSLPYNGEECITYGVPTGAKASTPNWITILVFEFSIVTWALILFSFILLPIVFKLMNNILKVEWFQNKVDLVLYVFSSFLGLPVKIPDHVSLRVSLACWFIFSFVVTVAYKSSMGSKLTVPNKDPDINTFKELLNSKLELTGYNNMLRLMQYNDSEPVIKKMVDRFKVTDFDINYAVDRIAAEKKIAYVRHTTTFLYYALINPKAKGHIHVIKDCIMLYHPMIVTKKHSPFSTRLNQLISRLMESGITKRWRSEYIYNVPQQPKPFLKLSNDHMYGVFCILCFGYALGLLAFFIEVIYFYLIKKSHKFNTQE